MAGKLEVTAFTDVKGPFMDSHPGAVLDDFDRHLRRKIAERGVEILKEWPFKGAKGGGFQANLHVVERGDTARIPGPQIRGVTWSPWLEGTSKRNRSTPFKGYGLFRKTAERIQEEAPKIGDDLLKEYLPRLGGE